MANNLGIEETTLVLLTDAAQPHNAEHTRAHGPYDHHVVRVTGHADDDGAEQDDPLKMAIFTSRHMGDPWVKEANNLKHVIFQATGSALPATCPADVTTAYPNYLYANF